MIRLIYASAASQAFDQKELDELLAISRRNNKADKITGMLLYRDGDFLQVLEGEEANVKQTCERIFRDQRHGMILELDQSEIKEREFEDWSMGFRRVENNEIPEGYVNFFDRAFDDSRMSGKGNEALNILKHFKNLDGR